jgi:predicted DNA-binding protein
LQVLEERDRLEEENERIEEEEQGAKGDDDVKVEGDEKENKVKGEKLSEEEMEERLDALRARLTKELDDELAGKPPIPTGPRHMGKRKHGDEREWDRDREENAGSKGRKQFKSYQVHELAEAKIEESEQFRRALGIKKEGEDDGRGRYGGDRRRDAPRDAPRRRRSSNDGGEETKYRDWDDPRERDRESRDDRRRY